LRRQPRLQRRRGSCIARQGRPWTSPVLKNGRASAPLPPISRCHSSRGSKPFAQYIKARFEHVIA
jgi:hypothetical protein